MPLTSMRSLEPEPASTLWPTAVDRLDAVVAVEAMHPDDVVAVAALDHVMAGAAVEIVIVVRPTPRP